MVLLVARLVDVQIVHAGAYEAAARGESSITVSLPSLRGGIYARDGSPLALSVATEDVVADDFQVAHPVKTALALSPMLNVPAITLATKLHEHSGYVVLARQLSEANAQKITSDAIPGITLIADAKRVVPNGNLASPSLASPTPPDRAPPASSTGTTASSPGSPARRPSWSRHPG